MDQKIYIGSQDDVTKGEPWFEDGNMILLTYENPTAFRLHRGVLERHSEIFKHMLELPQPDASDTQFFEGCQVILMYDLPTELSNLAMALYDGPKFTNSRIEDFFYVAGILRLANKYFLGTLRQQAIQFLSRTWGTTLKQHDEMLGTALNSPGVDGFTYPYVHPLHVLNLARETDVRVIVPSALYFLSLYPLSDIIKGDHPKLLVEHPSKPSSSLTSADLLLYSLMYQHRLELISNFIRQFCGKRSSAPLCRAVDTCGKGLSRLVSQLHRSWSFRTGPLYFISQAIQHVSNDLTICAVCRSDFSHEASILRQQIWDELPAISNMSSWDQVERN